MTHAIVADTAHNLSTACKQVCIVYHSPYGHTERVARAIADGARQVANTQVHVMSVEQVDWHALDHADVIILVHPPIWAVSPAALSYLWMQPLSAGRTVYG